MCIYYSQLPIPSLTGHLFWESPWYRTIPPRACYSTAYSLVHSYNSAYSRGSCCWVAILDTLPARGRTWMALWNSFLMDSVLVNFLLFCWSTPTENKKDLFCLQVPEEIQFIIGHQEVEWSHFIWAQEVERRGSGARLWNLKAGNECCTSSSNVLLPQGFCNFPHQHQQQRTKLSNRSAYGRQFFSLL